MHRDYFNLGQNEPSHYDLLILFRFISSFCFEKPLKMASKREQVSTIFVESFLVLFSSEVLTEFDRFAVRCNMQIILTFGDL